FKDAFYNKEFSYDINQMHKDTKAQNIENQNKQNQDPLSDMGLKNLMDQNAPVLPNDRKIYGLEHPEMKIEDCFEHHPAVIVRQILRESNGSVEEFKKSEELENENEQKQGLSNDKSSKKTINQHAPNAVWDEYLSSVDLPVFLTTLSLAAMPNALRYKFYNHVFKKVGTEQYLSAVKLLDQEKRNDFYKALMMDEDFFNQSFSPEQLKYMTKDMPKSVHHFLTMKLAIQSSGLISRQQDMLYLLVNHEHMLDISSVRELNMLVDIAKKCRDPEQIYQRLIDHPVKSIRELSVIAGHTNSVEQVSELLNIDHINIHYKGVSVQQLMPKDKLISYICQNRHFSLANLAEISSKEVSNLLFKKFLLMGSSRYFAEAQLLEPEKIQTLYQALLSHPKLDLQDLTMDQVAMLAKKNTPDQLNVVQFIQSGDDASVEKISQCLDRKQLSASTLRLLIRTLSDSKRQLSTSQKALVLKIVKSGLLDQSHCSHDFRLLAETASFTENKSAIFLGILFHDTAIDNHDVLYEIAQNTDNVNVLSEVISKCRISNIGDEAKKNRLLNSIFDHPQLSKVSDICRLEKLIEMSSFSTSRDIQMKRLKCLLGHPIVAENSILNQTITAQMSIVQSVLDHDQVISRDEGYRTNRLSWSSKVREFFSDALSLYITGAACCAAGALALHLYTIHFYAPIAIIPSFTALIEVVFPCLLLFLIVKGLSAYAAYHCEASYSLSSENSPTRSFNFASNHEEHSFFDQHITVQDDHDDEAAQLRGRYGRYQ
ncbi:hypothetical protein N9Y17_05050, partial [Gammaproteobacteria bacterium]|nr:hypothetical protein [Gammaproteobacteria bacterium]